MSSGEQGRGLPADLPAAARAGDITAGSVRGPRDAVELTVWRIWREHFGTAPVDVNSDYFELGGSSLGAVRLLAAVGQQTGVRLPLEAVLRAPTVAAMAALVRAGGTEDAQMSSLITIRSGARAPVLVCVHPIGGTVLWYRHLADALPAGVSVLGLQARGLDIRLEADTSIPAMARHYVADTLTTCPAGRVVLVGYSFGGLVAHEMAYQLAAAGTPPAGVLLLDTSITEEPGDPPSRARLLWSLAGHALGLDVDVEELVVLAPEERARRILDLATARGTLPPAFGTDRLHRLIDIYQVNSDAERAFRPGRYQGTVDLVRPREGRTDKESLAIWKRAASGGIRVHDVPGDHFNLIAEDNVHHVAGVVQRLWYSDRHPKGASR